MKFKLFGKTLEIKASASDRFSPWNDSAWDSYFAGRGYAMTAEKALQISAVFRCVDLVTKTMATMPLNLYKKTQKGKEKATAHRLYPLLHSLPNPQTTAYEFWQMYFANLMLTRGAFAKIQRDYKGYIVSLWNIPTGQVGGVHTNTMNGERYIDVSLGDGLKERLREGEFMYTPGFLFGDRGKPDDPMGIAADVLGLTSTITQYAQQAVNGVNPGGFIEIPAQLSDKAYERFKTEFSANYGGAMNAGKFLFLEEGGKASLFDRDLEKMQVLESRKNSVVEICRLWGVPPHLCMDLEHATFSNIEHQSAEFVRDCINPLSVRQEQVMYRDLLSQTERAIYFYKFNTNSLMRGDTATRTAYYNSARNNGWLNGDEIRALEDMDEMPDGQGQIFTVNGNMIPLAAVPLNLPKGAKGATV